MREALAGSVRLPCPPDCETLIRRMLAVDPTKRITISQIWQHRWMQADPALRQPTCPVFSLLGYASSLGSYDEQALGIMQTLGVDRQRTVEVRRRPGLPWGGCAFPGVRLMDGRLAHGQGHSRPPQNSAGAGSSGSPPRRLRSDPASLPPVAAEQQLQPLRGHLLPAPGAAEGAPARPAAGPPRPRLAAEAPELGPQRI